jgi:hypothetical protein
VKEKGAVNTSRTTVVPPAVQVLIVTYSRFGVLKLMAEYVAEALGVCPVRTCA